MYWILVEVFSLAILYLVFLILWKFFVLIKRLSPKASSKEVLARSLDLDRREKVLDVREKELFKRGGS